MQKIVRLQLKDGLGFPDDFISPAEYYCVLYYKLPENWLDGEKLLPEKQEACLENMYGKTWRSGNEDGSYYAVLALSARVLSDAEVQERIWLSEDPASKEFKYWFYHVADDGTFKGVSRDEF
jgi:hypothetical protein